MSAKDLFGRKCSRRLKLKTSPSSVIWFSRNCGSLDFPQLYRPPQPATGMALYLIMAVIVQIVVFIIITTWSHVSVYQCLRELLCLNIRNDVSTLSIRSGYIGWLLLYIFFFTVAIGSCLVFSCSLPADLSAHLSESRLYNWHWNTKMEHVLYSIPLSHLAPVLFNQHLSDQVISEAFS
jgi:hypothetical protein